MATISFEMKDSNGVNTEIGDEIKVRIPEVEYPLYPDDNEMYFRPAYVAKAKILLPPSKGLQIRIIEILDVSSVDDDDDAFIGQPGDVFPFRRTVWKWHNLTRSS